MANVTSSAGYVSDDVDTRNDLPRSYFSDDEIEEFRQIFGLYDHDGDGRIPLGEVSSILKNIGVSPKEDIMAITGIKDLNTGSIDFEMFMKVINQNRLMSDPKADVLEAFRLFDRDDDGYLTAKDLKQVMFNIGEKLTDEEVDEMVRLADTDNDCKITYDDFVRMLSSL